MKNNDDKDVLFPLLHDYLLIYLPKQRGVSPHTVLAYRKSLESLLDYVKERKRVPLCEVTFEMLTKDMIVSFLFGNGARLFLLHPEQPPRGDLRLYGIRGGA